MKHLKFLHSGKLGDLIYALWSIKALGGGEIIFNLNKGSLCTQKSIDFLIPLLKTLPYVTKLSTAPNMNNFENDYGEKMFCRQNPNYPDWLILDSSWFWGYVNSVNGTHDELRHWIDRYAYTFGITVDINDPVLEMVYKKTNDTVVLARADNVSQRFTDDYYKEALEGFDVFEIKEGTCKDALELRSILSSCGCFVGTYTMPTAVAQALQTPRIIEIPKDERFWYDAFPIGNGGMPNWNLTPFELHSAIELKISNLKI